MKTSSMLHYKMEQCQEGGRIYLSVWENLFKSKKENKAEQFPVLSPPNWPLFQ